MKAVAEGYETPANGSQFHFSREEALQQPTGMLEFEWNGDDPYLFNRAFDEAPILYDDCFCTTDLDLYSMLQIPTLAYFDRVLAHLPPSPSVANIGCGQGEFVEELMR